MTQSDIGIVEKLDHELIERIRKQLFGNLTHYQQHRSYETDDCKQVVRFINEITDPIITEMVEALEAFVDAWDSVDHPFQPQMPRLYAQAKATLAKVSGK